MRVTQDQLYDSEATLRLVDSALDELQLAEPQRPTLYRTMQLRVDSPEPAGQGPGDLRVYWGIQAALEVLADGRTELRPALLRPEPAAATDPDRLSRALALVDGLGGDERDPARAEAFARLRGELLGLAGERHASEERSDAVRRTAGLLQEMETRLSHLAFLVDGGRS